MSISSRISAMQEHLQDDYSMLEIAGADLTNVDKNIINLKPTWKERLLYFMNNGTDEVWNNWEKVIGEGTSLTLNNTEEAKMKIDLKGNTSQNGTPTPSSPIPVNVVSGDNEINICGKNLFNPTETWSNWFGTTCTITNQQITWNGTSTTGISRKIADINLPSGTYTISLQTISGSHTSSKYIWVDYMQGNTKIAGDNFTQDGSKQKTLSDKVDNIKIGFDSADTFNNYTFVIQIEKNSTATTYEPYIGSSYPIQLGDIELCKIGTYQDKIDKSTGKNLFDKDNANILHTYFIQNTTTLPQVSNNDTIVYIPCQPNTTYTCSKMLEPTSSKNTCIVGTTSVEPNFGVAINQTIGWQGGTTIQRTITTTNNDKYLMFFCYTAGGEVSQSDMLASIQIEKGNQATPYEPYGKVWYLHKEIGKVVLDGSENWGLANNVFYKSNSTTLQQGNINVAKSNYFQEAYSQASTSNVNTYNPDNSICGSTTGTNRFYIKCTNITSTDNFKTWLSTHNTIVYFVLATPTYEEITDSTLLSQLNALANANSYDEQTNVSQVNNDLASILNATALEDI